MLDTTALSWLERRMRAEEMIGAAVDYICGVRPAPQSFHEYAKRKTHGVLWLATPPSEPARQISKHDLKRALEPTRRRQGAHRFLMRLVNEVRMQSGLPALRS